MTRERVGATRHSDKQIDQAAQRFEQLADTLDPDTAVVQDLSDLSDLSDLNAVAVASQAVQANEARLRAAVRDARKHGRSWNQLATALGVSRQAARQRFGDKPHN